MIQLRRSGLGWEEIANSMPGRTAEGCRLRYRCCLKKETPTKGIGTGRNQPEVMRARYVEPNAEISPLASKSSCLAAHTSSCSNSKRLRESRSLTDTTVRMERTAFCPWSVSEALFRPRSDHLNIDPAVLPQHHYDSRLYRAAREDFYSEDLLCRPPSFITFNHRQILAPRRERRSWHHSNNFRQ